MCPFVVVVVESEILLTSVVFCNIAVEPTVVGCRNSVDGDDRLGDDGNGGDGDTESRKWVIMFIACIDTMRERHTRSL